MKPFPMKPFPMKPFPMKPFPMKPLSYCTLFLLHPFPIASLSYCTLFLLHPFPIAPFCYGTLSSEANFPDGNHSTRTLFPTNLFDVSFCPSIRRVHDMPCDLDIAMYCQRFLWTIGVDSNSTLKT